MFSFKSFSDLINLYEYVKLIWFLIRILPKIRLPLATKTEQKQKRDEERRRKIKKRKRRKLGCNIFGETDEDFCKLESERMNELFIHLPEPNLTRDERVFFVQLL